MDAFQITKYALIQLTGLIYAIFICGASVKFIQWRLPDGGPLPLSYHWSLFMRDYGILFAILILVWTAGVSYFSIVRDDAASPWWVRSALISCFLVVTLSTYFAMGTLLALFQ